MRTRLEASRAGILETVPRHRSERARREFGIQGRAGLVSSVIDVKSSVLPSTSCALSSTAGIEAKLELVVGNETSPI